MPNRDRSHSNEADTVQDRVDRRASPPRRTSPLRRASSPRRASPPPRSRQRNHSDDEFESRDNHRHQRQDTKPLARPRNYQFAVADGDNTDPRTLENLRKRGETSMRQIFQEQVSRRRRD